MKPIGFLHITLEQAKNGWVPPPCSISDCYFVYLDIAGSSDNLKEIIQIAQPIRKKILETITFMHRPVIVGPIKSSQYWWSDELANEGIECTDLTYKEYMKGLEE